MAKSGGEDSMEPTVWTDIKRQLDWGHKVVDGLFWIAALRKTGVAVVNSA
jgi:hypothetical protein